MGGTGLLIYGTLSADRLEPQPVPRTLFDRLLERTREAGPKVLPMGRELLNYLEMDGIPSLYCRGEREAGSDTRWYVQLGSWGAPGWRRYRPR